MTQITDNQAAWQPFEKSSYYKVGPAPAPIPTENEVVIKVAYAAVNPTDWKVTTLPEKRIEIFNDTVLVPRCPIL